MRLCSLLRNFAVIDARAAYRCIIRRESLSKSNFAHNTAGSESICFSVVKNKILFSRSKGFMAREKKKLNKQIIRAYTSSNTM